MKKNFFLLVLMMVVLTGSMAFAEESSIGTITGKLMMKGGGPVANSTVLFFSAEDGPPPSQGKYWRVPEQIVTTDVGGQFTAQLAEGRYYLTAVKRMSGREMGPPQEGDFYLPSQDKNGKFREYSVKKGKTTKIGTIAEVVPFKKKTVAAADITAIEGTVTDEDGKPVEGVLVFAFASPAMVGTPLFASDKTGKDGKYILRVDRDGTFYLKIREVYGGGIPKTGELIGGYGQKEAPLPVTVKDGVTVKGIDIQGMKYGGRGTGLRLQ